MATTLYKPYCTLRQVQKETRNKDAATDDWYRECINAASRSLESFCLRDFWFHDHSSSLLTVKQAWVVEDRIYLPWPVITFTQAVEAGTAVASDQVIAEVGSRVILKNGFWKFYDKFPVQTQPVINEEFPDSPDTLNRGAFGERITLQGTFGYVLESVDPEEKPPVDLPADLSRACTLVAAAYTMMNQRELVGIEGDRQSMLDSRIPKEARTLLCKYKTLFL